MEAVFLPTGPDLELSGDLPSRRNVLAIWHFDGPPYGENTPRVTSRKGTFCVYKAVFPWAPRPAFPEGAGVWGGCVNRQLCRKGTCSPSTFASPAGSRGRPDRRLKATKKRQVRGFGFRRVAKTGTLRACGLGLYIQRAAPLLWRILTTRRRLSLAVISPSIPRRRKIRHYAKAILFGFGLEFRDPRAGLLELARYFFFRSFFYPPPKDIQGEAGPGLGIPNAAGAFPDPSLNFFVNFASNHQEFLARHPRRKHPPG